MSFPLSSLRPLLMGGTLLCLSWGFAQASENVSLENAIDRSLKHNFQIRIAKNENRTHQNNKSLGTGGMLPTVDAAARIRETGGSPQPSTWEAGIEASWTLFDGFRMFHNKSFYNERASLSLVEYRQKVEKVVVDVFQAYFNSVTQTFLLKTSQDQVKISQERLDKINFKKSLGTSSKSEQLNAQVALNEDRAQVQKIKLQKLIALNSLKLLMGLSVTDTLEVDEKFNLPKVKQQLEGWVSQAQEKNSHLTIRQKSKRLEEINLSMAKSAYWPRLVVAGSYGAIDETGDALWTDDLTYSVSATLRFPLLAGFKDVTNQKNTSLKNESSELMLNEYQKQLESLVHQQWAVLQNAYQQVVFELDAVELAKENLSISQQQLSLGNIEGVAFREAQLSLIKALTRLATSKFEARLALIELERLAGEIRVE